MALFELLSLHDNRFLAGVVADSQAASGLREESSHLRLADGFVLREDGSPMLEVINKLPKPSATRSDVDVAVIDDYTVIFQAPTKSPGCRLGRLAMTWSSLP